MGFKGNWKKGSPVYGFVNLFNTYNYFFDNKSIKKYFFLIKIISMLLNALEIISKFNLRTYLLVIILIISIIIY